MTISISAPTFPAIFLQTTSYAKPPKRSGRRRLRPPPIFISTNPSHINLLHLTELFISVNYSCHRFPTIQTDGHVEPVDPDKLRIAVAHSSLLVSVFCKPNFFPEDHPIIEEGKPKPVFTTFAEFFQGVVPVTQFNGRLVGFGRAVSDNGLTASIHDVVVAPSLQGQGIGKMIVRRIIRMLTGQGIYDVSAICSNRERLFFEACGFGGDVLGSTTMMYTRGPPKQSTSKCIDEDEMLVKRAGRMVLLVPPLATNMCIQKEDH